MNWSGAGGSQPAITRAASDDSSATIHVALGANAVITLGKAFAAWFTGSTSMLAEAVHSLADCGNQGLLLLGLARSKRPANSEYPLGHGREIYFWSFIVALMLFSMGGMFSVYEGIHKLNGNAPMKDPWVAIAVLLLSLIAESISLSKCLVQVNAARGAQSLWRWFRETRQSELLVILGEDIAATLGLTFALLAVAVTMASGNPFYDALGSIVIGVLLLIVAVGVGVETKALLVGRSAAPGLQREITRFLGGRAEVAEVLNLITLQQGADVVVAIKARMSERFAAPTLIAAINDCERALRAAFPQVRWIFFEPDVTA